MPKHTAMVEAQELHGEVLDPTTANVWQSIEPITRESYQELSLAKGWLRVGIGTGAMDEHWFTRSPGAEADGPMEELVIDGRRFGLCARPASAPAQPQGPDGPRQLLVQKHHAIRFAASREIPVLRLPDGGHFVHVIEGGENKPAIALPDGWQLETVKLLEDWVLQLPTPTTVFFFPNGDSYQGPIDPPRP